MVCVPLIAEEITEYPLPESYLLAALKIFLKNFAFWVRVFSIFCTYISEGVFKPHFKKSREEVQTKCTIARDPILWMQALRELSGKGVWIQSAAEPDAFRVDPLFHLWLPPRIQWQLALHELWKTYRRNNENSD